MSINIALQGLSVARRSFEVASQNISNANTPGYSRQKADISSRGGFEQGVKIQGVNRIVDQFSTQQLWSSSAAFKSTESFSFFTGQIDNLLANSTTNISTATDQFFARVQAGVDDPASIPNRELILEQSHALARRFSEVDRQLSSLNETANSKLVGIVDNVNEMTKTVAQLNDSIRLAEARGASANELEDQRDDTILKITKLIGGVVQTRTGNSDISLYVGNGQPLVVGGNASTLIARPGNPDFDDVDLIISISGKEINIRNQVSEGEVGGVLAFRDEVLKPAWNELGRLAIVFADTVNKQQLKGMDLNGEMGSNWFSDPAFAGEVKAFTTNITPLATTSSVKILETSQLKASDYEVKFGKDGAFTVTRDSDGKVFAQSDFAARNLSLPSAQYQDMTLEQDVTNGRLRLNLGGVDIELKTALGVTFATNDRFLIQPVRFGAAAMKVELASGEQLAFAAPVRSETAVDNSGTLTVGLLSVSDSTAFGNPGQAVSMSPPVQVVFNADGTFNSYDVSDPSNPLAYTYDDGGLAVNRPYQAGASINFNGFNVVLSGKPAAGDKVSFTANQDAVSDNRNALQLSGLQQQRLVDGATYQDNFGRLVERVGSKASAAAINLQANEVVMLNAESIRNGISGVNLDEEAADIIKFQQQYQAASQVISTARSLFDTLLSVTGG